MKHDSASIPVLKRRDYDDNHGIISKLFKGFLQGMNLNSLEYRLIRCINLRIHNPFIAYHNGDARD